MGIHLRLGDLAVIKQLLHFGVILGAGNQPHTAEHIQPRIADVCPVSIALLHDAGDASGARRFYKLMLVGVVQNRLVPADYGRSEKAVWVFDLRLRVVLKHFGDHLHGDLCCNFAVEVATHAVSYDHEHRIFAVRIGETILIVFAAALAALLKNGKFHGAALENFFGQGLAYGVEQFRFFGRRLGYDLEEGFLQMKHALWPIHIIELQAPVDCFQ